MISVYSFIHTPSGRIGLRDNRTGEAVTSFPTMTAAIAWMAGEANLCTECGGPVELRTDRRMPVYECAACGHSVDDSIVELAAKAQEARADD